ncbi:hypothetical protein Hanom_Chr14g01276921 [Helianthus anomalus]
MRILIDKPLENVHQISYNIIMFYLISFKQSEERTFWWLNKLAVVRRRHLFLQLYQNVFHRVFSLPIRQNPKLLWIHLHARFGKNETCYIMKSTFEFCKSIANLRFYHSSFVVDTSHVDPRMESDSWWFLRIVFVAK